MNLKRITSAGLALCMALSLGVSSFAADENEISESGGKAFTPVTLTTSDSEGKSAATKMSVIVPTTIPIVLKDDGSVVTANNLTITNKSYGAVRVKSATLNAENGWRLVPYGNASTLASEKVDSDKFGFQLKLGTNGSVHKTDNSDDDTQVLISSAETGCYMSGVLDNTKNSIVYVCK